MMCLKSNPKLIKLIHGQTTKNGGVIALLASTLAFSPSAFALNTTIGNLVSSGTLSFPQGGQSFINDPTSPVGTGTGATINLDTWTFAFDTIASQTTAAANILTIYSGTGNQGTAIGTSLPANASVATVTGFVNPVTWTFTGGLAIIDNQTYTAIVTTDQSLAFRTTFVGASYPNGSLRFGNGSGQSTIDTVFQGTFSAATPVPFEFSPALRLGVLGGLFALKKLVKKKKAS